MKLNFFEGGRRVALLVGGAWVLGWVVYAVFSEPYVTARFAVPGPGMAHVATGSCGEQDALGFADVKDIKGNKVNVTICFTASRSDDGRMLVPYAVAPWEKARKELEAIAPNAAEPLPSARDLFPLLEAADRRGDVSHARTLAETVKALDVAEKHAVWIVSNERKVGTPEFATRADDYRAARATAERLLKRTIEIGVVPRDIAASNTPATVWLMHEKYNSQVTQYVQDFRERFVLSDQERQDLVSVRREAFLEQWTEAGLLAFGGAAVIFVFTFVVGWVIRGFMGIPRGRDERVHQ